MDKNRMRLESPDERKLLQGCLAQDKEAWDTFVETYNRLISHAIAQTLKKYSIPSVKGKGTAIEMSPMSDRPNRNFFELKTPGSGAIQIIQRTSQCFKICTHHMRINHGCPHIRMS